MRQTTFGLGHQLMRPVSKGCLYSNYTIWFLDLRPDFRLDRVCNTILQLLNFLLKVQFFAETYFHVFKLFAKIAKIRFSRKFPVIRYMFAIHLLGS